MKDKEHLEWLVTLSRAGRLNEAEAGGVAGRVATPTAPPNAPTPSTTTPPVAPSAATGEASEADGEAPMPTLESIIEQLNVMRGGRSLKDEAVQTELGRYFDSLEDSEKTSLHAYLKGIAQIMSGQVDASVAEDPVEHGVETKLTGKRSRSIKPNVIRSKTASTASTSDERDTITQAVKVATSQPREDTRAPTSTPIVPKKRV